MAGVGELLNIQNVQHGCSMLTSRRYDSLCKYSAGDAEGSKTRKTSEAENANSRKQSEKG